MLLKCSIRHQQPTYQNNCYTFRTKFS